MDTLEVIKNASRAARDEFRKRVEASGLKGTERSDGAFVIRAEENPGADIGAVLERNRLDFERYATGLYIASCLPSVQKAVADGLGVRLVQREYYPSIH